MTICNKMIPFGLGTNKNGLCTLLISNSNAINSQNNNKQQQLEEEFELISSLDHPRTIGINSDSNTLMDTQEGESSQSQSSSKSLSTPSSTLCSHSPPEETHDNLNTLQSSSTQLAEERSQLEFQLLKKQANTLAKNLADERGYCRKFHFTRVGMNGSGIEGADSGEFGETEESEMEKKRLRSDVRHLTLKLIKSERQIEKMEEEIRRIKVNFLSTSPFITTTTFTPDPSSSTSDSTSTSKVPLKRNLMGDAEAEHLLLASKRISHISRIIRVPPPVVPVPILPTLPIPSDSTSISILPSRKGKEREHTSTLLHPYNSYDSNPQEVFNHHSHNYIDPTRPPILPNLPLTPGRTTSSSPSSNRQIEIPSPTHGMDNLLQAANSLRPATSSSTDDSSSSPPLPPPRGSQAYSRSYNPTHGAINSNLNLNLNSIQDGFFSALNDVLTHESSKVGAAAGEVAGAGGGESYRKGLGNNFNEIFSSRKERVALNGKGNGSIGNSVATGTGTGSRGPQTRNRAPYIKWNLIEDEQLIKAILLHGTRWDPVASEVEGRTYHQCRQRFLRGLKRGKALPEELMRYSIELGLKVGQRNGITMMGEEINGVEGDFVE